MWNYSEILPLATEMSFKGFSISSSGDHFVQQSRTILAILVKGGGGGGGVRGTFMWNHFEIRLLAKEEMFKDFFSIFSSGGHFVQPSRTFLPVLVKDHKRNTSVKLLWNRDTGSRGDVFWRFFSIFSSGSHFVQPSGAILVILVEGHWWNTSVQIFWNQAIGQVLDVVEDFLFLALVAILFNGAEPLRPSWIFDWHKFSLFRSSSHPVAKEQVSAQSDLRFEKRSKIDF